jgi:SET domain-containing protein
MSFIFLFSGTFRMALFALRDIDPGEELTYDYNFSLFNPAVGQVFTEHIIKSLYLRLI